MKCPCNKACVCTKKRKTKQLLKKTRSSTRSSKFSAFGGQYNRPGQVPIISFPYTGFTRGNGGQQLPGLLDGQGYVDRIARNIRYINDQRDDITQGSGPTANVTETGTSFQGSSAGRTMIKIDDSPSTPIKKNSPPRSSSQPPRSSTPVPFRAGSPGQSDKNKPMHEEVIKVKPKGTTKVTTKPQVDEKERSKRNTKVNSRYKDYELN
jgi:hypothetical protein